MKFKLRELPYSYSALEPHISGATVELHYGKHHQGYMDKLAAALEDSPLAAKSLEHIVCTSTGDVFNNAAQVWNHSFYWNCMTPDGADAPGKTLNDRLDEAFGGIDSFKREFAGLAAAQFGSGWAWLVEDDDSRLEILTSSDAGNPMCDGKRPLLTLDVWEHAYYLDYQNERPAYIESFLDHLIDWRFVEQNLGAMADTRWTASA